MTGRFGVGPRYGWVIVGVLTLLLAATHGLMSGLSVFDKAILADLHIGRGELKLRDFLQLVTGGFVAIAIGYAASWWGPRTIIYLGLAALSLTLFLYGHVTDVRQIYALHLILAFCYSSCHIVVVVLLITRWFAARKGVALGIILAGESLGGMIFPQILVRMIGAYGWRDTFERLVLMPAGLALILVLLLRRSPEDIGVQRIGEGAAVDGLAPLVEAPSGHFSRQLWRPGTLLLLGAAGLLFYAGGGIAAHTFLYFQDRGLPMAQAATGLSLFFMSAFAGKFLSGFLADRLGLDRCWLGAQAILLAGVLLYIAGQGPWLWAGASLVGIGWGSCYTLTQVLIMELFAGPWLGRLSGVAVFVEGITAGASVWIAGLLFDRTGSYTVPFLLMVVGVVAAILCSTILVRGRPKLATITA
jgi:MFS family permease